jgi:hypothetical protein
MMPRRGNPGHCALDSIVYLDCIHVKSRDAGTARVKVVYRGLAEPVV